MPFSITPVKLVTLIKEVRVFLCSYQVRDKDEFFLRLGCDPNTPVKVVSIFGNTGDGKSHTLNHTLFDGAEVFKTSHLQSSCTAGVWAAYDHHRRAVVLDTEGLLGVSANENRRTRLLLKVCKHIRFFIIIIIIQCICSAPITC